MVVTKTDVRCNSSRQLTVQDSLLDELARRWPVSQLAIELVTDLGALEVGFLAGEGVVR